MSKILIVIICAGASIGLLVGGLSNTQGGGSFGKTMAEQRPPSAESITCAAMPVSLDDICNKFFVSINGLNENHKCIALQKEIKHLQSQLATTETGTIEHNEITEQLNKAWGKLSVLLGELGSQIDVYTKTLFEISQEIGSVSCPVANIDDIMRLYFEEDK